MSFSDNRMTGSETAHHWNNCDKNPANERNDFGHGSETTEDIQEPSTPSFEGSDRIFPIRSAVSINPNVALAQSTSYHDHRPDPATDAEVGIAEPRLDSASDITEIELSDHSPAKDSTSSPEPQPGDLPDEPHHYITPRHEYVATKDGHKVTVGRDRHILQNCEDEPIHVPGAVQSFGVVIALREESPNQLVVRVVSENSTHLLGYSPQQLFALHGFFDILHEEHIATFTEHLDYVRDDGHDVGVDGPEVFLLSIRLPSGDTRRFWCAVHVSQKNKDIIICEFELEDDEFNPLNIEDQMLGPFTPGTTPTSEAATSFLGAKSTPTQFAASTVSSSQSFRALRYARRRKGEAAAMQIIDLISPIQEQLSLADDLGSLLEIAAGLVKELAGFHRVLVYQFDSDWNGKVVAELVDPQATVDLYKGLHFPASDIPAQARELYKINKVRLLYDRDHSTSRLVCRTLEDLEVPLDMTHSYLRAMSPIHTQYLANMGVRSSMSISINAFGNLWGLISCHSYGSAGMRVSFPIRKLCRIVGDTVARNIERIERGANLQIRQLANAVPRETNPANYILASSGDLLRFLGADSGVLLIGTEMKILGGSSRTEDSFSQEMLALIEFLRARQVTHLLVSRDFAKDFPEFKFASGVGNISGVLCVPLSTNADQFLVFFRRGQRTTVTWAGNPHEVAKRKKLATGGDLTPRQSFKRWSETILSQSREWSESDIATATLLGSVYSKFIQVWRQKEVMKQNSRLTRLLVANSAHEVRTPLNAIINYLELALESTLDEETREGLVKSHSASKSLIYIINDLLDLTTTADPVTSQQLVNDEAFDLLSTFEDVTNILSGEAKRKGVSFSVSVHPGLPVAAMGDQRRVRQVFLNLISNAIQNTAKGSIKVAIYPSSTQNTLAEHVPVEMTVTDTGSGMSKAKRDKLFQELEQVSADEDDSIDEASGEVPRIIKQEKDVLGLGLALTARIVHNMHGQLFLRSEEGKGSQFKILLQFRSPEKSTTPPSLRNIVVEDNKALDPSILPDARGHTLLGESHQNDDKGNTLGLKPNESSNHPNRASIADEKVARSQGHSINPQISSEGMGIQSPQPPISPKSIEDRSQPLEKAPSTFGQSSTSEDVRERSHNTIPPLIPSDSGPTRSVQSPGSAPSSESNVKLSSQSQSSWNSPSGPHAISTTCTSDLASDPSFNISSPVTEPPGASFGGKLRVLVAEDDPISKQLVQKRLQKIGHTVCLTSNGEACFNAFSLNRQAYDVILMDIQMPVVDGWTATKMIRELEAKTSESETFDQPRNVPIFAVSASIVETDKDIYINHGFNGWIMKPVNFTRLRELLGGVTNPDIRRNYRPKPQEWGGGGWFDNQQTSVAF